ncbi:rhomboid family intramembrane serine protease [Rhodotorula paludigena]|uniref:rhomboid family intramembrane serine protease n=1 Tax=Rhodotorula paludigena TaxID=86838 RepID=UPI003171E62F
MAFAGPVGAARALLQRIARPPAAPLPFFHFSRSSPSFPNTALAHRPLATFTPSYALGAPARPSPTFAALGRAFRQPARRTFSSSAIVRGIRPYHGRGGSGSSYGRRRDPNWRDRIDALPGQWIVIGLIATNVAVYLAWSYGQQLAHRFRDVSWVRFLQRNFTVSWNNITQGRVWTLVTSAFSHEGTGHILVNMLSLYFMAPAAMSILGNSAFLGLYLFAGVTASTFSLLVNHFITRNPYYSAHGASGATYGAISFFAACFPRETFLLFFVVPVPAWLCVSGIFVWDLYNGFIRRGGMTDSAGHVGGVLAGLLFFLRKVGRI